MRTQKKAYSNVCLVDAFRNLGVPVPYGGDGPFWALKDGLRMLCPFGLSLRHVPPTDWLEPGRYVVNTGGHFEALRVGRGGFSTASVSSWCTHQMVHLKLGSVSAETLGDSVGGATAMEPQRPLRFTSPILRCHCGRLLREKNAEPTPAVLYSLRGAEEATHIRKRCKYGSTYHYNYRWSGGKKVNTAHLSDVAVVFTNANVAFCKKFLEYHVRLQFRGFISTSAIQWAAHGCLWLQHCVSHRWQESFNDAKTLFVALTEFAPAPLQGHLFALGVGAPLSGEALGALDSYVHARVFPPQDPATVDTLSMDGHEKVLVRVCSGATAPGRPRLDARTQTPVARKKEFTCGWMMTTDPRSSRVLAVEEQKEPENNAVKKAALGKILCHYPHVNALIHDRNCSFQTECARGGDFPQIKYWCIDKWHGAKHCRSCPCNPHLHPRLARRLRGINTSCSEQVFAWFRKLQPHSQRNEARQASSFCSALLPLAQ